MAGLRVVLGLASVFLIPQTDGRKQYSDMFAHKHSTKFPPIPGWDPDSNPWDDYLFPPFRSNELELERGRGKPVTAHITSDSPAIKGSCITFTAVLQYPPCQREDARGDLVHDEHCEDGMEASANGQVRSGYVYSWSSWLDDYGFGKCTDLTKCNVFPDGKPFPQSNDWSRKGYVYVWHTMGQYYQTLGGSSSSLTLNTTNVTLGAGMMEVMVYRIRERKKYSPMASDNSVYFVTDKIPLAVELSQKVAQNLSEGVFVRGAEVVFNVLLHDPGNFLKTAAAVNYIWDFRDGNQLVTRSNVATHSYCALGNRTVKLTVEAAFRVACPPATPTPMSLTSPHATESLPPTTDAEVTSNSPPALTVTPAPPDPSALPLQRQRPLQDNQCYHYMYGSFQQEIFITEAKLTVLSVQANQMLDVSEQSNTTLTVHVRVKPSHEQPHLGLHHSVDAPCRQVQSIVCDDVPPAAACEVTLTRTFLQPGTYCVNISLEHEASLALTSTHVTIQQGGNVSKPPEAAEVVLSASAILAAIFAFIAFMVYKRYKVYRPVRRYVTESSDEGGVRVHFGKLRGSFFPPNEERSHLLNPRPPL
ncbi:hypothetical protein AAFF_G00307550 [Aldrovandia affinis]|uniref:PKD domain-containing protein n=1 Tax=Aldrovandia affinis TaxID=143900 RepID=A0AAD7R846_9TELE|nr:hypothetical protein AAFF_G00307550 [Aldrovandia affinis]